MVCELGLGVRSTTVLDDTALGDMDWAQCIVHSCVACLHVDYVLNLKTYKSIHIMPLLAHIASDCCGLEHRAVAAVTVVTTTVVHVLMVSV